MHIHGGGFKKYYVTSPQWITAILNKCDGIIVLSLSWKSYYQSITNCSQIFIVENIVAFPVKKHVEKKDNRLHLLFWGLVDKQKGIFDLLEVLFKHYNIFHDQLVLHIGGNGKIQNLRKMINQYGLNDMVIYEGFVSGAEKINLLLSSDVFILPSYIEGLPISILEAMSYGKPILSTPVGGIPEVVENNVNGILFQPGDKEAITEAIKLMINNVSMKNAMGENSYERVKKYFPDRVQVNLSRIYEKLLNL